ncbi:MAG: DUF362 domain-containing protein [Planctomycetia bacterium]|nr:DUF362 domain-containing protein [Planctomycetia bacterium]
MDRKEFLKRVALAGLTTSSCLFPTCAVLAQQGQTKSGELFDLVAVMGGEPAEMLEKGMDAIGGIERFVKNGDRITIKPNIGWDKTPELAGNTNPDLIVSLIKACKDAGAKEVIVFDHTCDNWRKCYENSGIEDAAIKAGAKVMPGNENGYYREISLPKAKNLKKAKVHQAILDCDAWFNVPILKNHGGAKITVAMKNLMGIVFDRQYFHQHDLEQCIADICTIEKPAALNIVDAYRVLKSNGPRGKNLSDVVQPKGLFLSTDIVAVDTAAIKFFGQIEAMPLDSIAYLSNGQDLNVGTMDLDSLKIKRIRM